MILRPQRNFSIVRQLPNWLDTTTYFVQAVVRDAYTDTILDTLNLVDKGGQRFVKNWQVPADPSQQGRDISIVTSVYIDSGYTTKSENYGDDENSYLIEDNNMFRQGGSSGVDAYTVRRIIQEELQKAADEEDAEEDEEDEAPESGEYEPPEVMRWDEILAAINRLETALKPEAPEKLDMKPILKAFASTMKAIEAKEVTPATDLAPLHHQLHQQAESQEVTTKEMTDLLNKLGGMIINDIPKIITETLGKATFNIAATNATMKLPAPKESKSTPFDITKLTL